MGTDRDASGVEAEKAAQAMAERGDLSAAATIVIQTHGPGLIGWLRTLTAAQQEAEEVFAEVCERFWRALPTFAWGGSVRTWMYVTARNLVIDRKRRGQRRPQEPLSNHPGLAAAIHSTTAAYRKTAAKSQLAAVRESLPEEDRTLLILRVDQGMTWAEIADVVTGGDVDPAELRKTSARLRKQLERLKVRLRAYWEREIAPSDGRKP